MAQTILFSKKNFINWISKQIKDDECVIMSDAVQGTLSVSNKGGYKIPFVFSSDIFPTKDIRNVSEIKILSLCIPKINKLSERDVEEVKNQPLIK